MSEIQRQNMNTGISSTGQTGQAALPPTAVQESQKLGIYIDNVLGNESGMKQSEVSMDAVMSGCLGGYLGLGEKAFEGLENPLASSEILHFGRPQQTVTSQAIQPLKETAQSKTSETLASFDSPEVSEVALGLVPGIGVNVASAGNSNPLAVNEIKDNFSYNNPVSSEKQNTAMVNFETLTNWEMDFKGEVAQLENIGTNALALNNANQRTMAIDIKPGTNFDVRPVVSNAVIEGNRHEYSAAWNQMTQVKDTLASYDSAGNNGLVGVADFLGQPNSATSGIGYNQSAPVSNLGYTYVPPVKELIGHNSIVNRELFGFLDMTTYSQSASTGVNPADTFAYLRPGKYVSNLIDGYYT